MSHAAGPLLAVDTATERTSVALWRDGAVGEEALAPDGAPAAEVLLPTIEALLGREGAHLADIEAFAVSSGPGSFTGLRIGLATVKGLAFPTGTPVVGVPTLAALALRDGVQDRARVAVLDARRGEVYAAGFGSGGPADWLPEGVYPAEALADRLPRAAAIVGEATGLVAEAIRERRPDLEFRTWTPGGAGAVARLGARGWDAGAAVPPAAVVPRYVRRAEAEVKRTGSRFEPDTPLPAWLWDEAARP